MDNVEEWMNQFFEKFVQANIKYSSIPTKPRDSENERLHVS